MDRKRTEKKRYKKNELVSDKVIGGILNDIEHGNIEQVKRTAAVFFDRMSPEKQGFYILTYPDYTCTIKKERP